MTMSQSPGGGLGDQLAPAVSVGVVDLSPKILASGTHPKGGPANLIADVILGTTTQGWRTNPSRRI